MSNCENIDLISFIQDSLSEEIKKADNHSDYDNTKNNYHLLSKKGKYLSNAFDFHMKLDKLIADLNKVEIFVRIPFQINYAEIQIDDIDYINYHLEVFYHKISTIHDVMELFINEVYELGLSNKDCNWDKLKTKRSEKNSNVMNVLELYFKTFEFMINLRHSNTHKSQNINPESTEISALILIQKIDPDNLLISPTMLKSQIAKHRREKVKLINEAKEIAEKYVNAFMCGISADIKEISDKK